MGDPASTTSVKNGVRLIFFGKRGGVNGRFAFLG